MACYNAVPPPSLEFRRETVVTEDDEEKKRLKDEECCEMKMDGKPDCVSKTHWERFKLLKSRREETSARSSKRQSEAFKRSALKAVKKHVTVKDIEDVLNHEGGVNMSLSKPHPPQRSESVREGKNSERWQEVRKYLDPNPQLKGVGTGHPVHKSGLESKMDAAVKTGRFEEAAALSDTLSQRELANKLVTAFDCHKYVTRKNAEVKKRRAKKPKLKWKFQHKERWEMKGNM